ncbi:reverse transcriptase [Phytophthora megakarya]|uniref:Reverse transcriptase n=1 Tax=Phytophthora megakarya TaxID=4795 RepID=A0A225VQ02_9STRA|nr:reverse transcriptase [Phytophthora megakarya]
MVHLAAVAAEVISEQTSRLFVDMVFKHLACPAPLCRVAIRALQRVSKKKCSHFLERSSQCRLWIIRRPAPPASCSSRVDLLKSYAQYWSDYLPMAEFAINNAVHASIVHTPFFVNAMRHPRLPIMLGPRLPAA